MKKKTDNHAKCRVDKRDQHVAICRLEEADDVWTMYNVIAVGDSVKAKTTRKMNIVEGGEYDRDRLTKVQCTLMVKVEKIDYLASDATLRVSGKVSAPNSFVACGVYHTLKIHPGLLVEVHREKFNTAEMKLLLEMNTPVNVDTAVLLVASGSSQLFSLSSNAPRLLGSYQLNIPKNRRAYSKHSTQVKKFVSGVLLMLETSLDLDHLATLLIAGPGMMKESVLAELSESGDSRLRHLHSLGAVLLTRASSVSRTCIDEILSDRCLATNLKGSRMLKQVHLLEEFKTLLCTHPDQVCYGVNDVEYASEIGAIRSLLVADRLYRSTDVALRQRFSRIVEDVMNMGAQVIIAAGGHNCEDTVAAMGGFAAILKWDVDTFPETDL